MEWLEDRLVLSTTIAGTTGNDIIEVRPWTQPGQVEVFLNGDRLGAFATDRLDVRAGLGDDQIIFSPDVTIPGKLFGGPGNDILIGGGARDVLVGGTGNDVYRWLSTQSADDQIIEWANQGFDSIDLSRLSANVTFVLDDDFVLNEGTDGATFDVSHLEHLIGTQGDDWVVMGPGVELGAGMGQYDGQGGNNTLDYSRYDGPIEAQTPAGFSTGFALGANLVTSVIEPLFEQNAVAEASLVMQTPINFTNFVPTEELSPLQTNYSLATHLELELEFAAPVLEVVVPYSEADPAQTMSANGENYQVVNLHFHTPAEHHVQAEVPPMEIHIVHRNANGIAVVGILVEEGAQNPALEPIVSLLPMLNQPGDHVEPFAFDLNTLLPDDPNYVNYTGSLTTEPFSEPITWYVFTTSIQASAAQIQAFVMATGANDREVQPINGRTVFGTQFD